MNFSRATAWLLVFNIAMFLFLFIMQFTYGNYAYLFLGAQFGPLVEKGEWFRIFTALFLHGGFLHLFFNMYALYYFGNFVESYFGTWRFLVIYFTSGVVGNIATQFFYYGSLSIGASGAIFGLVAALFIKAYSSGDVRFRGYAMGLLPMIIFNVVYGFIPGSHINNAAHIGGLLTGLVFGKFMGSQFYYVSPNEILKKEFWTNPWYQGKRKEAFWMIVSFVYLAIIALSYILLIISDIRAAF